MFGHLNLRCAKTTSAEGAEVHSDKVSFVDVKGSLVRGNNVYPPPPNAASRRRWGRNGPSCGDS